MGNSHSVPHGCHIVCTLITQNMTMCSHSFTTFFTQYRHIGCTLCPGGWGGSPWPTFVDRSRGTNKVGHYILTAAYRG